MSENDKKSGIDEITGMILEAFNNLLSKQMDITRKDNERKYRRDPESALPPEYKYGEKCPKCGEEHKASTIVHQVSHLGRLAARAGDMFSDVAAYISDGSNFHNEKFSIIQMKEIAGLFESISASDGTNTNAGLLFVALAAIGRIISQLNKEVTDKFDTAFDEVKNIKRNVEVIEFGLKEGLIETPRKGDAPIQLVVRVNSRSLFEMFLTMYHKKGLKEAMKDESMEETEGWRIELEKNPNYNMTLPTTDIRLITIVDYIEHHVMKTMEGKMTEMLMESLVKTLEMYEIGGDGEVKEKEGIREVLEGEKEFEEFLHSVGVRALRRGKKDKEYKH